eukprot:3734997-Pyramimonas_sp.AAC.1
MAWAVKAEMHWATEQDWIQKAKADPPIGALRVPLLRLRGLHPLPREEQGRGAALGTASEPQARSPVDRAGRVQGRHGHGA